MCCYFVIIMHLHSLLCWLLTLGAWIWAEWELWGFWCQSDFKLDHNILSSQCGEYILTMLLWQLGHELNTKSVNYQFCKANILPIHEPSTHRVLIKTKYEESHGGQIYASHFYPWKEPLSLHFIHFSGLLPQGRCQRQLLLQQLTVSTSFNLLTCPTSSCLGRSFLKCVVSIWALPESGGVKACQDGLKHFFFPRLPGVVGACQDGLEHFFPYLPDNTHIETTH